MTLQSRPLTISVDRGSRGYSLGLTYRGLDKHEEEEEKDAGIFVSRVIPGGTCKSYFF